MRKTQDDAMARTAAETALADSLAGGEVGAYNSHEDAQRDAAFVISTFKAVEFETTVKKIGDEEISLRRVVLTGPWEVAPGSK